MNIAMLDDWAYTISDFNTNYNPDVMIKMHMWSSACVVYPDFPTSFNLTTGNTYTYTYTYASPVNENAEQKNEINVFPNPLNNIVNIQFPNPENKKHTLIIYNAKGQVIHKIENITSGEVKVENINCEGGLNFFQLQNEKGTVEQGKLIIE